MATNIKEVNKETLNADLRRFTGSDTPYRYSSLFPHLYLTEGAKYLAEHNHYWLMDVIGSYQHHPKVRSDKMLQEIQFWTLEKNKNDSAMVRCLRDTDDLVLYQKIKFTDSVLDSVMLYVQPLHLSPNDYNEDGKKIILLPSEY